MKRFEILETIEEKYKSGITESLLNILRDYLKTIAEEEREHMENEQRRKDKTVWVHVVSMPGASNA